MVFFSVSLNYIFNALRFPTLNMVSISSVSSFKEILNMFVGSGPEAEIQTFNFFDLPELVIEKILKEYVSVTDKAGALAQIPKFKPYLQQKHLWYRPTLEMFRLVGSIKTGWYVECADLHDLYYFSADYLNLTVSIHYFNVKEKMTRIPVNDRVSTGTSKLIKQLKQFQSHPTLHFVKENDVFVYHDENFHGVYFWIFLPQKIVRWSENSRLYRLKNNTCSMGSYGRRYTLTLKDDFTVDCRVHVGVKTSRFCKSLSPLIFQPCFDLDESECKSCSPNCIHPIFRNMYRDVGTESMCLIDTCYYSHI